MRHVIAEREQEMVVAIVPRTEQLARFGNQARHLLLVFGAQVQSGLAVGHQVEFMVNGLAHRSDVDVAIKFARNHRRVDQHVQRDGLERDFIS